MRGRNFGFEFGSVWLMEETTSSGFQDRYNLGAFKPVKELGSGSFGDVIGEGAGRPKPAAYPV